MLRLGKELLPQPSGTTDRVDSLRAVVIGGGIAGVAAATVLAERGATVTLVEQHDHLGGRVGAWDDALSTGEPFEMERGFHAFFRQYYNLRALLRRIDPELSFLQPTSDYPILGPGGRVESFRDLPHTPPFNVLSLTRRTPHLGWRDLLKVNARAALAMLRFDPETTYRNYDDCSAREYLDSLRFPPQAREMLFNVFAHSFFNPEDDYSAAELLMMFHFYFMGNPEGLVFDVATRPFKTAIWGPFADYLRARGAALRLRECARAVRAIEGGWAVETDSGCHTADAVVLATPVEALQSIVGASPELASAIEWRRQVDSLALTNPFAVLRLWMRCKPAPNRAPFAGTTGVGILDNISLFELLEDESRSWADEHGGSVVELHAYAIDFDRDGESLRAELLHGLHELYPEYRGAEIVHERMLIRRDCPSFAPGSDRLRPGVVTPHEDVVLAGDFIKLPMPSALMERAATSGILAANHLLSARGVRPEVVECIPRRGLLARPRMVRERAPHGRDAHP